jgi:hypothetical protein
MPLHTIEGTWEEIERHKEELIGRHLRVMVMPEKPIRHTVAPTMRPSALGKYAYVAGGSEEFAKEKQAERHAHSILFISRSYAVDLVGSSGSYFS